MLLMKINIKIEDVYVYILYCNVIIEVLICVEF